MLINIENTFIKRFYFTCFIAIIIGGCQSKTEITIASQDLILTVYGLDGKPQPNAEVALFDDKDKFYIQNKTFGTIGAKRRGITDSEGKIKFDTLDSDVNYFVLAYTIDSTKYKSEGYRIYNDNSRTGFEFLQKLNKSSTTYASIDLLPAEALVSFYADNSNAQGIPVKIFIDNNTVGSINQIRTTSAAVPLNPASSPVQNGVITAKIRIGVNPAAVRFVNNFDCNNINKLDVVAGGFTPINVNRCDAGVVSFWTGSDNQNKVPIEITLNTDNKIGTLNTTSKATPINFKSANVLSRNLDKGKYTYFATSEGCNWQGEFTIASNQITYIELARCETGK